jgi:spore germination cell wall hydrolase CwlJ-like protein
VTDAAALNGSRARPRAAVLAGASLIAVMMAGLTARSSVDGTGFPTIAPAKAAVLVAATSGPASVELRATGEQAKMINAALPFSSGSIAAARPFVVSGDGVDGNRALLCLTQAVYYEAGFEPLEGRRAVAQVVLNRTRHPAYPKSVCGVVYQSSRSRVCQFTFVCDGSLQRAPEAGAWRQARAIAQAALAGYVERSVGSATHYHADYVAPRWAPLLAKVSKIGAHIFYRWPGAWGLPPAFVGRYIGEPADPAALRPAFAVSATDHSAATTEITTHAGPPVRRAPNDVGGLLDTSKAWKLTIPDPRELNSGASQTIAKQQGPTPPTSVVVASTDGARVSGTR